jgi:DNA polymerase-3 subunit alpha (Gram-positive type)
MKTSIEVYLVFDLETSGLKPQENAILEIACCPFDKDLNDLSEFESPIMKPIESKIITSGALQANGITQEQILKGVDPKQVLNDFITYLKSLNKSHSKIILAGHNIDHFDIPFLDQFFQDFKKDLSKYVNDKFTIDTLWWSRVRFTESNNFKLGTVCSNLGIDLINAHRAINDTRANKELLKAMIRNLRQQNSSEKVSEVEETRFRTVFEF